METIFYQTSYVAERRLFLCDYLYIRKHLSPPLVMSFSWSYDYPLDDRNTPKMVITIATHGVYDMILDFKFISAQVWDKTLDTTGILHATWDSVMRGSQMTVQKYMNRPRIINVTPSIMLWLLLSITHLTTAIPKWLYLRHLSSSRLSVKWDSQCSPWCQYRQGIVQWQFYGYN